MTLVVSVLLGACARPEEEALNRFLAAARQGDHAAVGGMSVVGFPGTVKSWRVEEVIEQPVEAFRVPELRQQVETIEKARDAQFQGYGRFRRQNMENLKRIQARLDADPDYEFEGNLQELRLEWEKYRAERRDLEHQLGEVRRQIDHEARLAAKSLMSDTPIDRFEGEVAVSQVLVKVRTKEESEKPYRFTLRKYNLRDGANQPPSRWIVIAIKEPGSTGLVPFQLVAARRNVVHPQWRSRRRYHSLRPK
ncbi:MAG: hypothetical protein ACE5JI_05590 [Acidobacteriota bacterium]